MKVTSGCFKQEFRYLVPAATDGLTDLFANNNSSIMNSAPFRYQSDAINMQNALSAEHICTRNCQFHCLFGNLYSCSTSQQVHVCDQTCNQRVWYDNHHSICRLSKRLFPHADGLSVTERKRSGTSDLATRGKRSCSGDFSSDIHA